MINETSFAGRPTVSKTITIVTRPACGMPAAPIDAAVAVILNNKLGILYKRVINLTHLTATTVPKE